MSLQAIEIIHHVKTRFNTVSMRYNGLFSLIKHGVLFIRGGKWSIKIWKISVLTVLKILNVFFWICGFFVKVFYIEIFIEDLLNFSYLFQNLFKNLFLKIIYYICMCLKTQFLQPVLKSCLIIKKLDLYKLKSD